MQLCSSSLVKPFLASILASVLCTSLAHASEVTDPKVKIHATQGHKSNEATISRSETVESLSRDILISEIQLEKYNLYFRSNAARQGRWKGWRYFASQETSLAMNEGALITSIGERGEHIHGNAFSRSSANKIGNGNAMVGAIGQIIAGSGSALELGINEFHMAQARDEGYGRVHSLNVVEQLVREIDSKIAEREVLLEQEGNASSEIKQIETLEGKILSDFRDLSIAEFERYHASVLKTYAQQNSFYALDIAKNASGSVGSMYLAYAAISHARALNRTGGILSLVSGGMIIADSLVSRVIGKSVELHDEKNLIKAGLPKLYQGTGAMESDYDALSNFCTNHDIKDRSEFGSINLRLQAYVANHDFCVNELERTLRAQRHGNRTAIQNIGSSFLVGGTKISSSTLTTIAGADYATHGQQSNALLFSGALSYLPGTTWGLLDNIRIQVNQERSRARQRKNHASAGEIVRGRLEQLDHLESQVR